MGDSEENSLEKELPTSLEGDVSGEESSSSKGPLSFLSGATTSGLFAWLCLGLSRRMVTYFTLHSPHYNSAIAESIASGFKTLVIGMCFLATFTFAFIGFGLTLVFIRSLFDGKKQDAN